MINIPEAKWKKAVIAISFALLFFLTKYLMSWNSNAEVAKRIANHHSEKNLNLIDGMSSGGVPEMKLLVEILHACLVLTPSDADAMLISGRAADALRNNKNLREMDDRDIGVLCKVRNWSCNTEVKKEIDEIINMASGN